MAKIFSVNRRSPEPDMIGEIAQFFERGEIVAYPTETIYGLGVDVMNQSAIRKLYDLKRRDPGNPISILVSDSAMLSSVVKEIPNAARRLMRKFWPGPLTILFLADTTKISKTLITNTGKVGVRISSDPIATAIIRQFGKPITTTSANLSGFPPSLSIKHIQNYFREKIPCLVDGGECPHSLGSTVVDVTSDTMAIIREGSIPAEKVIECFQNG